MQQKAIIDAVDRIPIVREWAFDRHIRRKKPFIENTLRQNNFLFVHVPKTGGTSVAESVHNRAQASSHLPYFVLQRFAIRRGFPNPFSCAVVRDPVERFVSAYCYSWRALKMEEHTQFEEYLGQINEFAEKGLTVRAANERYVYSPQAWFLRGDRPLDCVIPFPKLEEGHQKLRERFKFVGELKRLNSSRRSEASDVLTSQAKKRIREFYAEDHEIYQRALDAADSF